jgi:hypothetical protein
MISEYCKMLLNIRKMRNRKSTQLYTRPIIEERTEEMNSSINRAEGVLHTQRSEKSSERWVASERDGFIRAEESGAFVERVLFDFLKELQKCLTAAGERIDKIRSASEFHSFVRSKLAMS